MKPSLSAAFSDSNDRVDRDEIARFAAMAADWWDPAGPMAPLHRLNPVRLEWLTAQMYAHSGNNKLTGLKILDVGCGGGLVAEPLARLGAHVTGIDGAQALIALAQAHARDSGLEITYRHALTQDIIKEKQTFDVVCALEVIEHVPDPQGFIIDLATLTKPNGLIIVSTLSKTIQSFLGGIVGAEYVFGWLPRGTHDWRTFTKPSALHALMTQADLQPKAVMGLRYDAASNSFSLDPAAVAINYMMSATKP